MSTLTGNKISLTYKSLIKVSDNDILTATLQQLSDGLGNNSGVYLNTGGDLKSTGTLEFANFKGTSTSVTINKLVNQADGISSNDNDTSLPTSAAVKDYVDTHVTSQDLDFSDGTTQSAIDLDSQVFSIVGTTNEIDTVASGQQLQIGLPNSITISGTYTGATFSGDLNGTINTATTAVTQAAGNNSTKVATTAYVDTLDAASDLDFSGTSGTGDVNLNTQTFAITGAANQITTAASNQGLVISLLSSGVTLPNNSVATTQSAGDNSTKVATTAYVDVLDAASDLDIAGDSGTGDVNLNTQTFTLSGTTNQVTTAVSGQSATFSLPSTVHRNLQGNVTGNLTGNADTATKWATARNLSLTSEATGTISSVDGTQNVSGAVTLLNSAVTGKVLTGLPTPAAGNIQAGDSILEAFGKLQSQVSSISNGLIFKGSWDADTNTPTLTSGGGEVDSGTTTGQATNKLIQSGQNFNTTITVGDKVINQVDGTTALVTVIDSNTQLSLNADIMLSGEAYTIDASPFIQQGNYYVVNYAGTTNLNGNNSWSIGDWVIADADNRWSKLDHSQVDGQGTIGNLPVFATATTIGDSIVAQSGTALTVTGSLTTTLGASVTGDFAVNTNKFTVAAASGNTAFTGDLAINTNKFTVNATTGNTLVAGTLDVTGNATFGENVTIGDNRSIISNGSVRIDIDNDNDSTTRAFIVRNDGGTNELFKVQEDGNATFAGNVALTTGSQLFFDNGNTYISEDIADRLRFFVGGSEFMRFTEDTSDNISFYHNATFAGTIASNNIAITNSGNGELSVTRTSGATVKSIAQSARGQIGTSSNHELQLITNATSRLTIDTSGNSTFAGNVSASRGFFNAGATNVVATFTSTDATSTLQCIDGVGNVEFGASGDSFVVQPAGGVAQLTVGASSSTFAGSITGTSAQFIDTSNPGSTSGSVIIEGRRDGSANLLTLRARDASAPTSALPNGQGGLVRFQGFDGTDFENMGYIQVAADGQAVGDGDAPSFMAFGTSADGSSSPTERMRIDSSGLVEIKNTTPTLRLTNTQDPLGDGTVGTIEFFTNDSSTGATRTVSSIVCDNQAGSSVPGGDLVFKTSLGGSGSPVATEKLRIKDNGNVSIGTVNRVSRLTIGGIGSTANFNDGANNLRLETSSTPAASPDVAGAGVTFAQKYWSGSATLARVGAIYGVKDASNGNYGGGLGFYTQPSGVTTDMVQRMRITSGGNIEQGTVGTTSSAYYYFNATTTGDTGIIFRDNASTNSGFLTYNHDQDAMKFATGGSESMRITSGGDIQIPTDSAKIQLRSSGTSSYSSIYRNATNQIVIENTAGTNIFQLDNGGRFTLLGLDGKTQTGSDVRFSTASGELYYNTSSKRYKTNIVNLESSLDKINALRPVRYKDINTGEATCGLIAEETFEIIPDVVFTKKIEGFDEPQIEGLNYSDIVPFLIKSIQELKAEVDLLKQECKCK